MKALNVSLVFLGFLIGFIAGQVMQSKTVVASNLSQERLWNSVYDSTNNTIRVNSR